MRMSTGRPNDDVTLSVEFNGDSIAPQEISPHEEGLGEPSENKFLCENSPNDPMPPIMCITVSDTESEDEEANIDLHQRKTRGTNTRQTSKRKKES